MAKKDTVLELLAQSANPNVVDHLLQTEGKTAVHYAMENRADPKIIAALTNAVLPVEDTPHATHVHSRLAQQEVDQAAVAALLINKSGVSGKKNNPTAVKKL